MKAIVTHYGDHDLSWLTENYDDYIIYNRTDVDLSHSIKRENIGDCDYDKLSYIIDNYYDLPEVFLLTKSNLFKFITPDEFALVKDNQEFTPLLTQHHKTYEPICRYTDAIYEELNNSWYLESVPSKYFKDYHEFAKSFLLPDPEYLKFAPGGSYIVTRERVHRYGIDLYEGLRAILPYCQRPGEAHMIERTYYNLWS